MPAWAALAAAGSTASERRGSRRLSRRSRAQCRPRAGDVVRNDVALGTRQAVEHLVCLEHRAIVHLDGGSNPGANDRRAGYCEAMTHHGLSDQIRKVPGGYTAKDGALAAQQLLTGELPTAMIAANDQAAIGLLDIMIRADVRVP